MVAPRPPIVCAVDRCSPIAMHQLPQSSTFPLSLLTRADEVIEFLVDGSFWHERDPSAATN
jgi:hypothetical protein